MRTVWITYLGKLEWKATPFGLVLLPPYYSRVIKDTSKTWCERLHSILHGWCFCSIQLQKWAHLILKTSFYCFSVYTMKLKKYKILGKSIHFLGHTINLEGIQPILEKIKKVTKLKALVDTDTVKTFRASLTNTAGSYQHCLKLQHPFKKFWNVKQSSSWDYWQNI